MKVKVSEATGNALNYLVACAENMSFPSLKFFQYPDDAEWVLHPDWTIRSAQEVPSNAMSRHYDYTFWSPSTDWSQGGPIIEREEIGIRRNAPCSKGCEWQGSPSITAKGAGGKWGYGPTPLIAAMRCFVASKLGDEVEVPAPSNAHTGSE